MRKLLLTFCTAALVTGAAVRPARCDIATIGGASDANITRDVKDATIFENSPDNSNGAGPGMFAGTDGTGLPLRGLLEFDIADTVPAGATIFAVQLEMFLGRVAGSGGGGPLGPPSVNIELHTVSTDWGEGTTGQGATGIGTTGMGFPANPGDATWDAAMYPATLWTTPGGDRAAAVSAVTSVGTTMNAVSNWGSTTALVADVQGWLDNPATNFGWELINSDETTSRTFRAFWTKEASDPTLRPQLTVTYSLLPGDVNNDHIVNGQDIATIATNWLHTGSETAGDANFDGIVNGQDIALVASHWLHTIGGGASVPEPPTVLTLLIGVGSVVMMCRMRAARRRP